jgi:outer membrane protein assembly factor BamD
MRRTPWRIFAVLMLTMTACHPEFQLKMFSTNEALFQASLRQYQRGKWEDAETGFDKLTTSLPQRDTLLPLSYWYLGLAHDRQGEHLLAADAFTHIVSTFPDDSIAQPAGLESARSYRKLWRRPALDPEYGQSAIQEYKQLMTFYPNSKLIPVAEQEMMDVRNWFAIKDYDNAAYYFRLHLYDSGIIFLRDLLRDYPDVPKAKDAGLRLVDAYRAIKYTDDAADVCTAMRTRFPGDADVARKCPVAATPKPPTAQPQGSSKPPR